MVLQGVQAATLQRTLGWKEPLDACVSAPVMLAGGSSNRTPSHQPKKCKRRGSNARPPWLTKP